jgi:excisionase family DNA binding protein
MSADHATAFRTPEQIAQRTGLSRKAIYRAVERGELTAYRLCGRLRIHPDDEQAWIENHRAQPLELSAPRPRQAPAKHGLRRLLENGEKGPGLAATQPAPCDT